MRRSLLTTGISIPSAIGDAGFGGFLAGIMDTTKGNISAADDSKTGLRYMLIVSPRSLASPSTSFKSDSAAVGNYHTQWDGLLATSGLTSDATFLAANYCNNLAYPNDGASKWYLPAMDEMELIYRNLKPGTVDNDTVAVTQSDFNPPMFPTSHVQGVNPSSSPTQGAYTATFPAQTSVLAFRATTGAQRLADDGGYSAFWTSTFYDWDNTWVCQVSGPTPAGRIYGGVNTAFSPQARPVRRFVF